jgi:dihydropteroate synthase
MSNRYNIHITDQMQLPGSCDAVVFMRFESLSPDETAALSGLWPDRGTDGSGIFRTTSDTCVEAVAWRSRWEVVAARLEAAGATAAMGMELRDVLAAEERSRRTAAKVLQCGKYTLELGKRTLIMGILNVTPDSFSDGGKYVSVEAAVQQAKAMVAEGADIIDIGGESTRPDAVKVYLEEELARVIPVIRALQGEIFVPISIDTYKAEVARQALNAGASIVNDVWGLKADPAMAGVAAQFGCPIILMHNREHKRYDNLLSGVVSDLRESLELAHAAGIRDEQIVLDPGIGFGKTYEHNLAMMHRLRPLNWLGYPLLLGTSRKSMIRLALDLPSDQVLEGTAATVALGIMQGCDIIRVHDVKEIRKAVRMTDAIYRGGGSATNG